MGKENRISVNMLCEKECVKSKKEYKEIREKCPEDMRKKKKEEEKEVRENFISDEINEMEQELKPICNWIDNEEEPYNKKQLCRKLLFKGRCENVKGVLCEDICESEEVVEAKADETVKLNKVTRTDLKIQRIDIVQTKICEKILTTKEDDKENGIIASMLCEIECKAGDGEAKECIEEEDDDDGEEGEGEEGEGEGEGEEEGEEGEGEEGEGEGEGEE